MSFRKTATNSFFGNFLYDQVLDKDHFLVRLRHEVEWSDLCTGLMKAYKGGGEYGPSVYAPDLLLRYLLIPYLFGISERETEQLVNVHLLAKYFVGLGVSDAPPDHSTLTVFKRRVAKIKGGRGYATFWDKAKGLSLAPFRSSIQPIPRPMLIYLKKDKENVMDNLP